MLGRDIFVFEIVGFLERLLQHLVDLRRHGGLLRAAAARNLGQLLNLFVEIAEHGLRTDTDLLQHRRNDAFFIFNQRRQQMERCQLRIAVLGSEFVSALHSLLRFYGKFIQTDRHNSYFL